MWCNVKAGKRFRDYEGLNSCIHGPSRTSSHHHSYIWSCLDNCLVSFTCSILFISNPLSCMTSSSQFLCSHSTEAHMSYTQNSYTYVQQNKILAYTGPTTKTTKHNWVYGFSMHLTVLDQLFIPAPHHQSNQSPPKYIQCLSLLFFETA